MKSIKFNEIYAFTKFAKKNFSKVSFEQNDCLLFGNETSGLPDDVIKQIKDTNKLRIPMVAKSRSLNLSNSVAITIYEALRQNEFKNLA